MGAQRLSKKQLKWVYVPIEDGGIAPDDVTAAFVLDLVEDLMAGRIIYVHCWGGHGRTGVFVGLILAYLYRIPAEEVLKRVQKYHDCRVDPQGAKSPQTVVQREQVKRMVRNLLSSPPPPIDISIKKPDMQLQVDRFGERRMVKTSQSASCPAIGDDARDSPSSQKQLEQLCKVKELAMPSHLSLPAMPGRSAKTRRDLSLRQKSALAVQMRRTPFAGAASSALDVLVR